MSGRRLSSGPPRIGQVYNSKNTRGRTMALPSTQMNIELQPWVTPNFVIGKMPARPRQEGFNPDAAPKWSLAETPADVLAKQCDQFRAEIFGKAGKPDPAKSASVPRSQTSGGMEGERK